MQESEACLGHCQTFIELPCENVNGYKPLNMFTKNSAMDTAIMGSSVLP